FRRILSLLTRFSCQGTPDHWDPRFPPLSPAAGTEHPRIQPNSPKTGKELSNGLRRPSHNAQLCAQIPRGRRAGGADRVRTDDLRLARAALSQLSYSPVRWPERPAVVGLGRFELPTSRLSG